mgnify:CR=1 FL=1
MIEVGLNSLRTADEVWGELYLKWQNGIVAFAEYTAMPHGYPSENRPGTEFVLYLDKRRPDKQGIIFAVSSLVHRTWNGAPTVDSQGIPIGEDEMWNYFDRPMAMPIVDFDCPNSPKNRSLVAERLNMLPCNWYLFDSKYGGIGSYHLVLDALISPQHLPYHYGKILKTFANLSDVDSEKFLTRVGDWLMNGWNNWTVINWVISEILANVKHWDEPEKSGFTSFPDPRYLAHSMNELRRFLQHKRTGFGFLRTNSKDGDGNPSLLVAQKTNSQTILYHT